mmetsp:Transcript_769/g.2356  ORF Transcript_769/g.2356 Transcript_769/m.2356 type:complete len:273 (+) Transcript_769:835-1653(+)
MRPHTSDRARLVGRVRAAHTHVRQSGVEVLLLPHSGGRRQQLRGEGGGAHHVRVAASALPESAPCVTRPLLVLETSTKPRPSHGHPRILGELLLQFPFVVAELGAEVLSVGHGIAEAYGGVGVEAASGAGLGEQGPGLAVQHLLLIPLGIQEPLRRGAHPNRHVGHGCVGGCRVGGHVLLCLHNGGALHVRHHHQLLEVRDAGHLARAPHAAGPLPDLNRLLKGLQKVVPQLVGEPGGHGGGGFRHEARIPRHVHLVQHDHLRRLRLRLLVS